MRGFVDRLSGSGISGWIFDPEVGPPGVQVRATLGERVLAEGIADRPRPDVARLLGTGGTHGFHFAGLGLSDAEAACVVVEAKARPEDPWRPVRRRPGLRVVRPKPAGGRMAITVVGTSHIAALRRALPPDEDRYEIVNLTQPRPGLSPDAAARWREAATGDIAAFRATLNLDSHFVSMLGGNDHNAIGLIEHPQRFDLLEPGGAPEEVDPKRELIPYDALRALLEQRLTPYLHWLAALAPAFAGRKLHLCSPPPVPSAEHIRKFPGVSKGRLDRGVTPARIRAKLYDMSSDIFRTGCAELGIDFLPPPLRSTDAGGFLRPEYWNPDPTHANSDYGRLLLKQIEEHLAI